MSKIQHQVGSIFRVPLEGKNLAIGVIVGMHPAGQILTAYFFKGPANVNIDKLKCHDAIGCLRLDDAPLEGNLWPIVGHLSEWNEEDWPNPLFYEGGMFDPSKLGFVLQYDLSDPFRELFRRPATEEDRKNLQPSGICYQGAVEDILLDLIKSK